MKQRYSISFVFPDEDEYAIHLLGAKMRELLEHASSANRVIDWETLSVAVVIGRDDLQARATLRVDAEVIE